MNQSSKRDETIFHAVLLLPLAKRAEYLDLVCVGDSALRGRVEKLLQEQTASDSFFEKDALAIASGEDRPTMVEASLDTPGTVIVRYKIREKIGEGGCGIVFLRDRRNQTAHSNPHRLQNVDFSVASR